MRSLELALALALLLLCAGRLCGGSSTTAAPAGAVLQYLQSESSALSGAQQSITQFLHSKRIPVGGLPRSMRRVEEGSKGNRLRIAVSAPDNNLECRISLGRAPIGRKCVSPCGCTGSQQWIQFAELNRLRRKEPSQWTKCQTCQQTFDYSMISQHGGVTGNVISAMLDNVALLRASLAAALSALAFTFSFNKLAMRFLVSRALWQQYPKWVKLLHLPLVLKFWGLKIVGQYFWAQYLTAEGQALEWLSDLETTVIEPRLPAENQPAAGQSGENEEEEEGEDDEEGEEEGEEEKAGRGVEEARAGGASSPALARGSGVAAIAPVAAAAQRHADNSRGAEEEDEEDEGDDEDEDGDEEDE